MTGKAKSRIRIVEKADRIKFVSFYRTDLTKMGVSEQDDKALGRRWRKIIIGVTSGESGHDPLADRALREALERMEHGRKGAAGRWGRDKSDSMPEQCPSNARAMLIETETENRKVLNPKPKKKDVSISGDKSSLESEQPEQSLGKEAAYTDPEPCRLAAKICREEHQPKTLNTFKKRLREIGDKAFRDGLHIFLSEIEAGEEPVNRGAALNRRLSKISEAMKIHKMAQQSLDAAKTRPA